MWPANDDFGVEYAIRHYIVISIPVNLHLDNKSINIEILEIKIFRPNKYQIRSLIEPNYYLQRISNYSN